MTSERSPSDGKLVLTSRARPFATLIQSDFGGPRSRQRLVLCTGFVPAWLCAFVPEISVTEAVIAVAGGRAKEAFTTRVRAIIVYPARERAPEIAYVYLEERLTGVPAVGAERRPFTWFAAQPCRSKCASSKSLSAATAPPRPRARCGRCEFARRGAGGARSFFRSARVPQRPGARTFIYCNLVAYTLKTCSWLAPRRWDGPANTT